MEKRSGPSDAGKHGSETEWKCGEHWSRRERWRGRDQHWKARASPIAKQPYTPNPGQRTRFDLAQSSRRRDGLPEPRGLQARVRRRGRMVRVERGSEGAASEAGVGDDRPGQGSLLHEEPPGELRVQALPHAPQQRGLLPCAHAGQEAPDQPRPPRGQGGPGPRAQGRRPAAARDGAQGAGHHAQEERGQDRPARVQDHQDPGPADEADGDAVPGHVPRDRGGGQAAAPVHERVRAEGRGAKQGVPVPDFCSGAVRERVIQAAEPGGGQLGGALLDALGPRFQDLLAAVPVPRGAAAGGRRLRTFPVPEPRAADDAAPDGIAGESAEPFRAQRAVAVWTVTGVPG